MKKINLVDVEIYTTSENEYESIADAMLKMQGSDDPSNDSNLYFDNEKEYYSFLTFFECEIERKYLPDFTDLEDV